ncbi:MAG: hypothetical protein ACI8QZ_004014 [Chlamydiales bacterium]|jgi:hypothetical protein
MCSRTPLAALALVMAALSFGAAAQQRVKPSGPADFETLHAAVAAHFNVGHFGKAYASAQELTTVIGARRAVTIRAALPVAPPEYLKEPFKEARNAGMQNQALFAMAAGVGNIIEQVYSGSGAQIQVTVTADSPFVQMFNMMLTNPAMVGEHQELIKYEGVMAMLETQSRRKTLKFVIGSSLVEAQFSGQDDDFILAMWNQKAVDVLHAAIMN